ncbi:MAG: response regulator [Humidesulfovibrio sp.]|nr:response regulator [Humidesulfovibrio sp.]
MAEKVLMVEAAANPLGSTCELLAKRFDLTCAVGVEDALKAVRKHGPFAVVLTDLRLPRMDGAALLDLIRTAHPHTVGLIMASQADTHLAMSAIMDDKAFRCLPKPASVDCLARCIKAALAQHKLLTAEQSFLRETMHGAVQALTDVLSLANPAAFGRSLRIQGLVRRLSEVLLVPQFWEVDMAAMLSHIGCVSLPPLTLEKIRAGKDLTTGERKLFESHPTIGAGLLAHIPRLELVAEIILKQHARFDENPPFGARVLKVVLDYDMLANRALHTGAIFTQMHGALGIYDPEILKAFESTIPVESGHVRRRVTMRELKVNMILEEDIVSVDGMLLLAKDAELNEANIYRLIESKTSFDIVEPVSVLVPTARA